MNEEKVSVIYITVKLELSIPIDKEEVEEVVSELEYNFEHNYITNTEICGINE